MAERKNIFTNLTPTERGQIIELLEAFTPKEVAQIIGCTVKAVYFWRKKFNLGGMSALADKRRNNSGPRATTAYEDEQILNLAKLYPHESANKIRARANFPITNITCRRRLQKAQHEVFEPNEDFKIEYNKFDDCQCCGCSKSIIQGKLRMSKRNSSGSFDRWLHLQCFFILRQHLEFQGTGNQLLGFEMLTKEDQNFVKYFLSPINKKKTLPSQNKVEQIPPEDQNLVNNSLPAINNNKTSLCSTNIEKTAEYCQKNLQLNIPNDRSNGATTNSKLFILRITVAKIS